MATDVDVQYFSHLNGLVLGNNWGDLIRLLDKALVSGIDFTQITAASIDAQGDVHITLYSVHNAMLFQVVELSGFAPASLNQKYRIKGVPNTTKLILKPHTTITETSVITVGLGKLASLGYDIVFRDTNDVKRVYRAKNPTAQHPFIRVDESLTSPDGTTGIYTSTYAKSAMVGLLEHMEHIDDYENPDVLQLPFDPSNPSKNWKISGTGSTVVRGWVKWYWAIANDMGNNPQESSAPNNLNHWELCGNAEFFFTPVALGSMDNSAGFELKAIYGCGVLSNKMVLLGTTRELPANSATTWNNIQASIPLTYNESCGQFHVSTDDGGASKLALGILPDYRSGESNLYGGNNMAPLEVPFYETAAKKLAGTLPHIAYSGKNHATANQAVPMLADNSMYITSRSGFPRYSQYPAGNHYFYLGELE